MVLFEKSKETTGKTQREIRMFEAGITIIMVGLILLGGLWILRRSER